MPQNLKTPLNAIKLLTQSLLNSKQSIRLMNIAKGIDNNSELLEYIINDILDFKSIYQNQFRLCVRHFTFTEVINDILTLFDQEAHEKKLQFGYTVEPDFQINYQVFNDYLRLKSILVIRLS